MLSRRGFIGGFFALLAAPAIVRADNLMRCRGVIVPMPVPVDLNEAWWLEQRLFECRTYAIGWMVTEEELSEPMYEELIAPRRFDKRLSASVAGMV